MVPMAPFYFPLVYTTTNTPTGNAFGGQPPIIGLFDWRPKDIDEAARRRRVRRQRQDLVLHADGARAEPGLHEPDQRRLLARRRRPPAARRRSPARTRTTPRRTGRKPTTAGATPPSSSSPGPATRRPGSSSTCSTATRTTCPDAGVSIVDNAPLHVINLTGVEQQVPDLEHEQHERGRTTTSSRSAARSTTRRTPAANAGRRAGHGGPAEPRRHHGRVPDGADGRARRARPVTVLYVQKILDGDDTGATALPAAAAVHRRRPFSGKTNHDISNVRLATTTDGVNFTDLGIVQRPQRPDDGRLQRDALDQPARHAARHQRRRQRVGPVLLRRQLPRRRLRRVPLHRLRRVDRQDALDRLQRHQPPDRVDQHDHARPTRRAARR